MTHFNNIEEALKELRPEDKVVKILSNKFAVVQSAYENGTFDTPSVCGLDKHTIYFYTKWYNEAKASFLRVEEMPNTKRVLWAFYTDVKRQTGCAYRYKTSDNRRYKRDFRKIHKLLKENFNNQFLS